jgi:hypothetical protein
LQASKIASGRFGGVLLTVIDLRELSGHGIGKLVLCGRVSQRMHECPVRLRVKGRLAAVLRWP